ncbi:MAG: 4'-phosphopantetheinyl transferase superfamily protein [Clostridia bacterium]|nr:4'-phosphopantetheinyl transferase superfamily protein [Clostridia bacterium]
MYKYFFEETELLSPKEQSFAAHSLLKRSLAEHFGLDVNDIAIKKDSSGAPFIEGIDDVFVSITHTKGMVACAFADSRVGVDAEVIATRRKSVENRVFTLAESKLLDSSEDENAAFFTLWTLKESWLKAIGMGFAGNAKEIEFYSVTNPVSSNSDTFSFFTEIQGDCALSVCIES